MSFAAASAAAEAAASARGDVAREPCTARQPERCTFLHTPWSFWYVRRVGADNSSHSKQSTRSEDYSSTMTMLGHCDTVEAFWGLYCYLNRNARGGGESAHGGDVRLGDVCLFRKGITPMWEDDANQHGGKVILRVSKATSARYFEELALALVGEQLAFGHCVCGAVLSSRLGEEDVVSVWTCDAGDEQSVEGVKDAVLKLLCVSHNPIEYRAHTLSAEYAEQRSYRGHKR